jgi:hypothetical protein
MSTRRSAPAVRDGLTADGAQLPVDSDADAVAAGAAVDADAPGRVPLDAVVPGAGLDSVRTNITDSAERLGSDERTLRPAASRKIETAGGHDSRLRLAVQTAPAGRAIVEGGTREGIR